MRATRIITFLSISFLFTQIWAGSRATIMPTPSAANQSNTANTSTTNAPNPTSIPNSYPQTLQTTPPLSTQQLNQAQPTQHPNPGNALSDADMTTTIQAKIMGDSSLLGTNISVKTINGVATLEGTANSQAQVDAAVKLAESVAGVKSVQSSVTVQAEATPQATPTAGPTLNAAPMQNH